VPRRRVHVSHKAPSMTTMSATAMVSLLVIHCQQAHSVAQFETQCIGKHMYRGMPLGARIRVTEWLHELMLPPPPCSCDVGRMGSPGPHTPYPYIIYGCCNGLGTARVNHLLVSWGDAAGLMRLTDTYPRSTKMTPNS
jgi:hypothetical protein